MSDKDLTKIPFFKLLNLEAVTPENETSKVFGNRISILSSQYKDLLDKNKIIKTGYENFCIKKGTIKLLPFKDFDFIGKHVVCQKCCQKFASKLSYRAHVGTDICVRTYNGPNLVYLKYKNRNCRQIRKKNKSKPLNDSLGHDIKKNLLNPEMLNTLQTRNNCYSDNIVHQRNKVKEKQGNSPNKNDEPFVKKPRGRPKKKIEEIVVPKKRGRPKKYKADDDCNPNNNCSDNNHENNDTKEKVPRIISVRSVPYSEYNNNLNETQKLNLLLSNLKIVTDEFLEFDNSMCKRDANSDEEEDKQFFLNLERLEYDVKSLSKRLQGRNEYPYVDELNALMSRLVEKRNEVRQNTLKKTDVNNGSTASKGKENIRCTIKKNEDETEINKIDFDKNEKHVGVWLNGNSSTIVLDDDCESIECTNLEDFKKESTSDGRFEENLEIFTHDMTSVCSHSVHHLNNVDLNYIYSPMLNCKICGRNFASIAEWKMHHSEHLTLVNKHFLCKICGLKFKMYKNFVKHVNVHGKMEQKSKTYNKSPSKDFTCKVCYKNYSYLKSYYAHIKTHGQ